MYSGFYCKKCKIIPFIKPNITINKDIKFMIKCKCHLDYLTFEQMNKRYYTKNIESKNIINEKINENIKNNGNILTKMNKLFYKININNKAIPNLKKKFLDFINNKIIKKIEELFDKTLIINQTFLKFAEILKKSYECLDSNYSNIKNIYFNNLNNFGISNKKKFLELLNENKLDLSIYNIKKYIQDLIPINPYSELEKIFTIRNTSKIFKISDNYLLLKRDDWNKVNLTINSISNLEFISKIKISDIGKMDIDYQKNILVLQNQVIKILPKITDEQIENFKKQNIDKESEMNIEPLIIFETDEFYTNIICWKNENDKLNINKCLIYNDNNIIFCEYDLIKKYFSIYHTLELYTYKIKIINNKLLLIFCKSNLFLYDIFTLNILKKFDLSFEIDGHITVLQINNNELLFNKNKFAYILDLKTYKIRFSFESESDIIHSILLPDKSIVLCHEKWARRYSSKTFEAMSIFHWSKKSYFDLDEFTRGQSYDYIRGSFQISEKEILIFFKDNISKLCKILV